MSSGRGPPPCAGDARTIVPFTRNSIESDPTVAFEAAIASRNVHMASQLPSPGSASDVTANVVPAPEALAAAGVASCARTIDVTANASVTNEVVRGAGSTGDRLRLMRRG